MGNEMGNNNTSGFREEEDTKAEAPEKSLLEGGGGGDVKPDEDAKFHQKEASLGSDDADRVNGDHRVTKMIAKDEEEDNEAYKPAEFQVISEKSTDRTKENSEVQTTSKESGTSVLNLEKNVMDTNGHKHERRDSNSEEEGEEDSNLNTIVASDDPILEKISDNKYIKHELQETKAGQFVDECNESPRECKDAPRLSLKHTDHEADYDQVDSEKTINTNQGIDTDRDIDKEKREEGDSDWNTAVLASDDPKSEKIIDLKCIQHELPETKAEPLVESSDGSPQEHDHAVGSGFKYTHDENGHLKDTEKSTDMDEGIGAETGADVEKKEDPLIEPKSCHDCIMSAAKNIDTQDGETIMDLIGNDPSSSQQENSLVVLSPNVPVQDPEVKERCTVLTEETQLKEEPSEIGIIVQDNISTQFCEISNEFQVEYNKIKLNFEINARETMVSPDSVVKIDKQTEAPNKVSDGENLDTAEQGMAILTSSVRDCKHENKEMVETTETSTLTKSKFTTNPINEQSAITIPIPTFDKEDQESPRRTSNESNSDNSIIVQHEMRKSPSFNVDIQSEGKGEDSEKIPLLYQIKTIKNSPNLQEISFPNPMEKRIVRSVSDKFKASSFLGFEKEKTETQIEITKLNQDKSVENLDRKVKRRSKSSIFGNCICCASAIN